MSLKCNQTISNVPNFQIFNCSLTYSHSTLKKSNRYSVYSQKNSHLCPKSPNLPWREPLIKVVLLFCREHKAAHAKARWQDTGDRAPGHGAAAVGSDNLDLDDDLGSDRETDDDDNGVDRAVRSFDGPLGRPGYNQRNDDDHPGALDHELDDYQTGDSLDTHDDEHDDDHAEALDFHGRSHEHR